MEEQQQFSHCILIGENLEATQDYQLVIGKGGDEIRVKMSPTQEEYLKDFFINKFPAREVLEKRAETSTK